MFVFFVTVKTFLNRSINKSGSIFDFSTSSDRKVNLVCTLKQSKTKIPNTFEKICEKQNKKIKEKT